MEAQMIKMMIKIRDSKRQLGIMLMVCALLVAGITSTGYADPNEQITGPAVVGMLTLVQTGTSVMVSLSGGKCRGNVAAINPILLSISLPTTAEGLRGLVLPGSGPSRCLDEAGGQDLIVKAVNPSTIQTTANSFIMADVVLLFVVKP